MLSRCINLCIKLCFWRTIILWAKRKHGGILNCNREFNIDYIIGTHLFNLTFPRSGLHSP